MPEIAWNSRSPLEVALQPGRSGARGAAAGVSLTEVRGFGLVQVMARRGRWPETATAAERLWGVAAPDRPATVAVANGLLVWSGPGQFFVLDMQAGAEERWVALRDAFAGAASLSDQSGGRCLLRLTGPAARDVLAKVSSLDFHDAAFPVGTAAATVIDHTPVNLWRETDLDGVATYGLLLSASYAESLWHLLCESAAEFGLEAEIEKVG